MRAANESKADEGGGDVTHVRGLMAPAASLHLSRLGGHRSYDP